MSAANHSTHALIEELVRTTGAADAVEAVRAKARGVISSYVATFGEPNMPMNVDVLASMIGIRRSPDAPVHSNDAELVPDEAGGVMMRVNSDRPETRQRFSVAHEISHTFFPGYSSKKWCRTDGRFRKRSDPSEYLEMLCDIGAAELLFPQPWFSHDCAAAKDATSLFILAATYNASREATLRRYAEIATEPLAAVFFCWKLKPRQKATVGNNRQSNAFGISPEEERRAALRLRIEYAIPSPAFREAGYYLPVDKSVVSDGPLYHAATHGQPANGECFLELGQAAGRYDVAALPLWTPPEERGPAGENAVAAIIRPLSVRQSCGTQKPIEQPSLF